MSQDLYQVEGIVGFKHIRGVPHYKVHWLGYSTKEDSWEPARNLTSCVSLIEEYHSRTSTARKTRYATCSRSQTAVRAGVEGSSGDEAPDLPVLRRSRRVHTPTRYFLSEIPARRRRSVTPKPAKKESKLLPEEEEVGKGEEEEEVQVDRSEYELRSHTMPRRSPRRRTSTHYFNSELPQPRHHHTAQEPRTEIERGKTAENVGQEGEEVSRTYDLRSGATKPSATTATVALSSDEELEEVGDTSVTPRISLYESKMRQRLSNLSSMARKNIADVRSSLTATGKTDGALMTKPAEPPSLVQQPAEVPVPISSFHVYETRSHTRQTQQHLQHLHDQPPASRMRLRSSGTAKIPAPREKGVSSIDAPDESPLPEPELSPSPDDLPAHQTYPQWMQLGWGEMVFTMILVGLILFAFYCFYNDQC